VTSTLLDDVTDFMQAVVIAKRYFQDNGRPMLLESADAE
jgi:hypothetical protein